MYSGPVAASGFFELAQDGLPKTIVILSPNHTGYGSNISLMRDSTWQTPLGTIQTDTKLSDNLLSKTNLIDMDETAHQFEHSIEVQLPFLQYLYGNKFKIVPICFLNQNYQSAVEIGHLLAETLVTHNALVIASSDLTHYEPAKQAEKKDRTALNTITSLNAYNFYQTIKTQNITACGYAPITALIIYAQNLNAKANLLNYRTSGDISGDHSSVVGYASVLFKK
jgi:AmmeMemoRadiSam system protein B